MKGTNKLEINQATMCAAMQHWMELVLDGDTKVKVTEVKRIEKHYGGDDFVVTFDSVEQPEVK